jgi:hypothetical protein
VHVVGGDPAAKQPQQRDADRVEAGEHQHPAAGLAQPGHGRVEQLGQRVRVTAGPQDVVAAARDADQGRRHGHRGRHLLGHDLPQQLAAHRKVGVPHVRVFGRQQARQPVGPAAEPAVGRGIVQAFGEAVADRDEGRSTRGAWK